MVDRLHDKGLTVVVLEDGVQCELNVLSLAHIGQVGGHRHVVLVDTLEEGVEALNDLEVGLLEGFVKLDQLD